MRAYIRGVQGTWWGDWWETKLDGTRVRHREALGMRPPEHDRADAILEVQRRMRVAAEAVEKERAALEKKRQEEQRAKAPRLDHVFDGWMRYKRIQHREKPRTIETLESGARRLWRELGHLSPNALTIEHVDAYKEKRLLTVSVATLNRDLDMLRNALRWASQRGFIEKPPLVERIRARRRDVPKLLDKDQVRALLTLCTTADSPHGTRFHRLEPVIRLALAAGLRAEEVRFVTWDDVDLSRGRILVTAKAGFSPKTNTERTVPLHDSFMAWIRSWRERVQQRLGRRLLPGDWFAPFFPIEDGKGGGQGTPGQQWVRGVMAQEVRKLFAAAEIPGTGCHHLHKLRGTFATRVLDGGGSIEALRQLLGHSDIRTTAMYLEATDQVRRKAVLAAGWDE